MIGSDAPASSSRSRASRHAGYSLATTAQKRFEWFISTRCASSWRPRSRRAPASRWTRRQARRIRPPSTHTPHALRALRERRAARHAEQRGIVGGARRERFERVGLEPAHQRARGTRRAGRDDDEAVRFMPHERASPPHAARGGPPCRAAEAAHRSRSRSARARGARAIPRACEDPALFLAARTPRSSSSEARARRGDRQAVGVDPEPRRAAQRGRAGTRRSPARGG